MTAKINTNKELSVDYSEWKKNIERAHYSYYDFSRDEVERIAKKNVKEVSTKEIRTLVQALFPQYLQCSGLFDGFLFFEVIDGVRVDPPKYCYETCNSYLNNDGKAKVNRLIEEIEDLFEQNEIDCSEDWKNYFRQAREVKNEKYTFRCFLLRLGYIGDESKADRKYLLQNLDGNSAFKGGNKNELSE